MNHHSCHLQCLALLIVAIICPSISEGQYIEVHRIHPTTARWFGKAKPVQDENGEMVGSWETPSGIREIFGIRLTDDDPPCSSFDTVSFDYRLSNPAAWFGLRINDYPLVDGHDAIWYLRNIPDDKWHRYTGNIHKPTNVWGEKLTDRRLLCWRVHSTKDRPTTVWVRNIVLRRFKILMAVQLRKLKWIAADVVEIPVELTSRLPQPFVGELSLAGDGLELSGPTAVRLAENETATVNARVKIRQPLPKPFTPLDIRFNLIDGDGRLASCVEIETRMTYGHVDGPSLVFTRKSLEDIRKKLADDAVTGGWWRGRFLPLVDSYLPQTLDIPTRGSQWPCHYICRKCGGALKMKTATEHVCTRCGTVHSGWPYDDCPLYQQHMKYAEMAEYLGIAYGITREEAYARKATDILLKYAELYPSYKFHDNYDKPVIGGGYAFSEALHEAIWHITLTRAFDCVREILNDSERDEIAEKLLLRFAEYVRTVNHGIHNHECWHLAAAGMVGLALEIPEYVHDAIYGRTGLQEQIRQGVSDDGPWFEGTWNYHFFTLQALEPFTLAALNNGIDVRSERYKSMYDAPFRQLTPTFELPAFHDSHRVQFTPAAYGKTYETAATLWPSPLYDWWLGQSPRRNLAAILWGRSIQGADKALPSFESMLQPSAGYGVLRSVSTDMPRQMIPQNYLAIDFGPHGGWHGHQDKLNIVLWLRNVMFAEDSGCASYADPRDKGWFKATISHNTVMLDGKSQAAATGRCLAFATGGNACIISCDAGNVYDDATLQRHVALIDDIVLDMFTVRSTRQRDIAWLFHSRDDHAALPGQACGAPSLEGAEWGEDWHEESHNGRWNASWEQNGLTLRLLQLSIPGKILSCRGMTTPQSARHYLRVNQIRADRALFASVLTASTKDREPEMQVVSSELLEDGSCRMEIVVDNRRLVFFASPAGKIANSLLKTDAKAALVEIGRPETVLIAE